MIGLVIFAVASAARRPRHDRGHCCSRPGAPGPRCRARLARRAGADHHDLPRRTGAQPRVRGVRRDVRCRCGGRPAARRLAHRPVPQHRRLRDRRLAPDLPDQRADRPRRGRPRAALPARVRGAPTSELDLPGAVLGTLGLLGLVYGFSRAGAQTAGATRGRSPAWSPARSCSSSSSWSRAASDRPAAAVPGVHAPHPRGVVRGDVPGPGRDVRDVLLPQPVHPERHGLQPDRGRRRVPAVLRRASWSPPGWRPTWSTGSTPATSAGSAP